MFKGIAARSYARTAISAPFAADQLRKTLEESAKSAAKACDGEGLELECAFGWVGEDDLTQEVGKTGLPEAFSALEAVQGLLYLSSNVSLVDPEGPAGSPSGNATVSPTGTPTGSPVPGQGDSAAHKMTITWAGVLLSVALAAFSL
jgi:mannan endo-1,6-alpha-mannosidase